MSKKLILLLALALTMSACGKVDDKPAAAPSEETAAETETTASAEEEPPAADYTSLNAAAKAAYNTAAELLADYETMGLDPEAEAQAQFAAAMSPEGISPSQEVSAEGDQALSAAVQDMGSYTVFLGYADIGSTRGIFVQTKDEYGNIGQYPDAVTPDNSPNVRWTEFSPADSTTFDDLDIITLNAAAKTAYSQLAELLTDNEVKGIPFEQSFAEGYPGRIAEDGLPVSLDSSCENQWETIVNDLIAGQFDGDMTVYAAQEEINGYTAFFVQVRDNSSGSIGQYPSPADEDSHIIWQTYTPAE